MPVLILLLDFYYFCPNKKTNAKENRWAKINSFGPKLAISRSESKNQNKERSDRSTAAVLISKMGEAGQSKNVKENRKRQRIREAAKGERGRELKQRLQKCKRK